MTIDTRADQLLMVLSSDWFLPLWPTMGLDCSGHDRIVVQKHLRDAVIHLMDGAAEYWQVSFSEARLQQTRQRLKNALVRCSVSDAASGVLTRVFGDIERSPEDSEGEELLAMLTELLVSGDERSGLSERVAPLWEEASSGQLDLHSLCASSSSAWDSYLRSLTPDIPMYLADFVCVSIERSRIFRLFWARVESTLDAHEKQQLIDWYESTGSDLIARPVELPKWLS